MRLYCQPRKYLCQPLLENISEMFQSCFVLFTQNTHTKTETIEKLVVHELIKPLAT